MTKITKEHQRRVGVPIRLQRWLADQLALVGRQQKRSRGDIVHEALCKLFKVKGPK